MRRRKPSPLLTALRDIREELARIADCLEKDLEDRGVITRVAETAPPSTIDYVDDEVEWARENIPDFDRKLNQAIEAEIRDYRVRFLEEADNLLGEDQPEPSGKD